jgi:hypothetical protein
VKLRIRDDAWAVMPITAKQLESCDQDLQITLYMQRTFGADIRGRSFHGQKLLA